MILLVYIDFVARWTLGCHSGVSYSEDNGNAANESWCYPSIWSNCSLGLV